MSGHGGQSGGGIVEKILKTVSGFGISELGFAFALSALVLVIFVVVSPSAASTVASLILALSPLWLPVLLAPLFWKAWIGYVRMRYITGLKSVLLEIRVPREITKSPRAMELIFAGINYGSGETTFINRWWEGRVRPWWSFEVASIGGSISFFVWTLASQKDVLESQIYAQYPDVEIHEVDDYAERLEYDPTKYGLWGCQFKEAEADALPIKTYVDFELDKDPDEEFKIDPLAHLFEFLSTLKPGEQVWFQIIIQLDKEKRHKAGTWFGEENRWKKEAEELVMKVKEESKVEVGGEEGGRPSYRPLTSMQQDKIKAIERSMDKGLFRTCIRGIYVAELSVFRASCITGLTGAFRQFNSNNHNKLVPTGGLTIYDYPWQDITGRRKEAKRRGLLHAYRTREAFYGEYEAPFYPFLVPAHGHPSVMTTEELASIYHFPSSTIKAPGLRRVQATKSSAPPNLPV